MFHQEIKSQYAKSHYKCHLYSQLIIESDSHIFVLFQKSSKFDAQIS